MGLNNISQIIFAQYGLEGKLSGLPGELDLNFKLSVASGECYIIKLMRPECDAALIDIQCACLIYLEKQDIPVTLPKVIRSKRQKAMEIVELEQQKRILWILTYCPGHLLAHFSPHSDHLMNSFGKSMAHLTNGLQGFEHPFMKRGHRWELTEALQVKDFAQYIEGPSQQIAVASFEQFEKEILTALSPLPHSLIHNDANDYNVLV